MATDPNPDDHPERQRLKALYDQTGIGVMTGRKFGVDFRILAERPYGDAALDRHLRYLKASVTLQLVALVIAVAGLIWWLANSPGRSTASVTGDWPFAAALAVAVVLVVWSLLRIRRGRSAFLRGDHP